MPEESLPVQRVSQTESSSHTLASISHLPPSLELELRVGDVMGALCVMSSFLMNPPLPSFLNTPQALPIATVVSASAPHMPLSIPWLLGPGRTQPSTQTWPLHVLLSFQAENACVFVLFVLGSGRGDGTLTYTCLLTPSLRDRLCPSPLAAKSTALGKEAGRSQNFYLQSSQFSKGTLGEQACNSRGRGPPLQAASLREADPNLGYLEKILLC